MSRKQYYETPDEDLEAYEDSYGVDIPNHDDNNDDDFMSPDTHQEESDEGAYFTEPDPEEDDEEIDNMARKCFKDYDFKKIMADYHSGDSKRVAYAKESAIYALEGVVRSIIKKRYSSYTAKHFEDLDQCGKLGIIKAMERYDANRGAASTFFHSYMLHEMQMYIDSYVNKTTPHYSTNIRKIKKAIAKLEDVKQCYTTVDIAQATGLTMEAVEQALSIMSYSDEVHYDNCTDAYMNENTESSKSKTPEDEYIDKEKREVVQRALSRLSDLEKNVILMAIGFEDGHQASHKEIAKELNIPLDKVKKVHAEAVRKLRNSELRHVFHDYIESDEISVQQAREIPILKLGLVIDEAGDLANIVDIDF